MGKNIVKPRKKNAGNGHHLNWQGLEIQKKNMWGGGLKQGGILRKKKCSVSTTRYMVLGEDPKERTNLRGGKKTINSTRN